MTFRTEHTLTSYARAAVDLKARMADYCRTPAATEYVRALLDTIWPQADDDTEPTGSDAPQHPKRPDRLVDAVARASGTVWAHGEAFVLAPTMTAIDAAADQALDLTGDLLTDAAPCDGGVLYPSRSTTATCPAHSSAWPRSPGHRSPAATGAPG